MFIESFDRPAGDVPRNRPQLAAGAVGEQKRAVAVARKRLGADDRFSNFTGPPRRSDCREVRTEKSAASAHHVALDALQPPEEEALPLSRIAEERHARRRRVQTANERDQLLDFRVGKREGRHRRALDAISDRVEQLIVFGAPHLPTAHQIGALAFALAAFAIPSMTARTELPEPPLAGMAK